MVGTRPLYYCATELKDHRGVVAYWATTPIRIDMKGFFGPYNILTFYKKKFFFSYYLFILKNI